MGKIKKRFFVALVWVSLRCRVYYAWSKVYRFLFERWADNVVIPDADCFGDVTKVVRDIEWRKDTWFMLWDVVSHPGATYKRHLDGKRGGDCDDISMIALVMVEGIAARKPDLFGRVGFLSVPWLEAGGKVGGHNVCAFETMINGELMWKHMSNWYDGKLSPKSFGSLEDVVRDVLDGNESLGWAFANSDLKLLRYGGPVD